MCQIVVNPDGSFESALKLFNRKVQQAGILTEARRRSHHESAQEIRKRKEEARRRKQRRSRVTH